MKINPISPIIFGYKSNLKRLYIKGKLPEVIYGIYGGILTPKNVTIEHIKPRSFGGKTVLNNIALAVNKNNWNRGNKPLIGFYDEKIFQKYLEQFKGIELPNFSGNEYINNLINTINEALRMK